ncbi:4-(cytidine 5'-diphospho)-2-C-methyl-D-erythritol kinase [Magnetovibrio sp.]|uniref:GHMP family kinase ATP-binding protein n=1 Tax=Magnetovibrio sp. TaxID=2024836 RepID=UPI002F91C2FB
MPPSPRPQRATVSRSAPAKINLYLHITGRRDDGYHELDSLVVFANVCDLITVDENPDGVDGLTLAITGPFAADLSADGDNLVLRAARKLAEHVGIKATAHITLEKNLPVASGIGGGSADAAAALKALAQFWDIELADEAIHHVAHDLADNIDSARALSTLFKLWRDDLGSDMLSAIGLKLGADVPVCLEGRPAYMGGIGEHLDMAPHLPVAWLVLVNPGLSVSTPEVFKAYKDSNHDFSVPARFHDHPRDARHLAQLLAERDNDLMAPAIALTPQIQSVVDALNALDEILLARMSGSGATCFGLFASRAAAQSAASTLAQSHPTWWVSAAEMLDTAQVF